MKFLLKFFVGSITIFLLSFVTFYLLTSGEYHVAETVETDSTVNSMKIDGRSLYFKSYGDTSKPLLVVLHGGPGYDSKYMQIFKDLTDSFHVIFYDQVGCGLSERVEQNEISLDKQLNTLNAILEKNKSETMYLLGHSWGAMLATAFVAKYPTEIQKLVLLEPEYLTEETKNIFFQNTNYMRPKFSLKSFSFIAKNWFRSLHINEPDDQASTDYLMGNYNVNINTAWHPLRESLCPDQTNQIEIHRFGAVASASLVSSIFDNEGNFRTEVFENARNYKNKVLIVSGQSNKINNNLIQQKHQEFFLNSTLKIIPEAGFFVHLDKPKETISITREFLNH